ncbi:MAG: nucleotidyltransferase family protein [Pseudomonadota bacterium]
MNERHSDLLRKSAYVTLDRQQSTDLALALDEVSDWQSLAHAAERAGLSNILYNHLQLMGRELDDDMDRQFKALKVRQMRAHRTRTQSLTEILDALAAKEIKSVLLKGAALAHVLYESPIFRPMSDIDLLVHADDALDAQAVLRTLGFSAGDRKDGYMFDHHHLPIAHKMVDRMAINVEVHHQALSGDATSQIDLDSLVSPLQEFQIEGRHCFALGHEDMLRHLCHHAFEPVETIKLGSVVDLYGYAQKNYADVNWQLLRERFPFVINAFRCLHFLTPLPVDLHHDIPPPRVAAPSGVGKGFPPLSETMRRYQSRRRQISEILNPPDWWLHVFYNVAPENKITMTRQVTHPLQVMRWIWRRIVAKIKSRTTRQNR